MFNKYPYWGWFLVCLLLWGIAADMSFRQKRAMHADNMAALVEKDLHEREYSFEKLLNNKELVTKIFDEKLSEKDILQLNKMPFRIFAYDNDVLTYWNTNQILTDCGNKFSDTGTNLLNIDRGFFIKKCISPYYLNWRRKLTILFPVVIKYPFENKYLSSHFVAADHIPVNTRILSKSAIGSYAVKSIDNKPVFHLLFSNSIRHDMVPGTLMVWLLIAAVLASISWFQLMTIYLTRRRSVWIGFLVTVIIIIGVRALTYIYGLPFDLNNLTIFSPQLYASDFILKSLGDLLLNALCLLWVIVFMLRHIQYNIFKTISLNPVLKVIFSVLFTCLLLVYAFAYINVTGTIVLDSKISFDVTHFYTINSFTIIGLFTIGIITAVSCLIIYLLNVQLTQLINNKWLKYLLIVSVGIVFTVLSEKELTGRFSYLLFGWLLLFIILLDIKKLVSFTHLFSPHMIFWSLFVCLFSTMVLQYFNQSRELATRKSYAEQILRQRDDLLEVYTFKNVVQNIERDRTIKQFLKAPTQERRRALSERFDALYLGGQLNKYQCKVLFFDEYGQGLYNNDTVGYLSLSKQIYTAFPTMTPYLYYKEYAQDGHYYIADIPITKDSATGKKIGYVFIDLAVKESTGESVYPELLQPGTVRINPQDEGYSYGVYVNKKLITHTNDNSFPVYLHDTFTNAYTIYKYDNSSELWYKADKSKTVVVIYYHKVWLESVTLFSYLFGINLLIIVLIVSYRSLLAYASRHRLTGKFINLTLRRRIHFSMLGIVLVSFLVIGIVTVAFFTIQYKQSSKSKLQVAMQVVERSILQYMKTEDGLVSQAAFNEVTNTPRFKYLISTLAQTQKVDINIYNGSGTLNVTSQENIYDRALLAPIMRPEAFYLLNYQVRSMVLQNETIGKLSYLSCYVPIRDEESITYGYINVPFFSSEKELNYQISNILVALINLYAFIFLFSGLMTVFITNWLTSTLNVVIKRFEKLNLKENELIDWPYDDEIGLLVREYNKMVKKVEYNAHLLAESEREGAWREMAKQVAHEIKNPLTPMKLNIQYLQQALKSDYSNIRELTIKVAESLIEQIDNLSYIASEFSNFAKLPEAKPEDIELNELLERSVELYLNEHNIKVGIDKYPEKLVVHADRSQLVRVFSNLLENAVQAIPADKQGIIIVSLQQEGDNAVVAFADNGVGIVDSQVEKIFQPYFTTKTSGTGLGLAMTKKIIEFWKGIIWFETKEKQGTTFFIKLPLANVD